MHHLSSAKLVRVVHLSRRPAHLPHRFRSALKSVRKHGSTVRRLCKIGSKISSKHDASTTRAVFVIRLKALGCQVNPINSYRQSTPELRAQFNLTNDHKRKKYHTCKNVLLPDHVKWPRALSWVPVKGTIVVAASSYALQPKKVIPETAGNSFNTSTSTSETRKKGQQFTLLRRITKLKNVNSDIVLLSTVSLERLSPKGSYHLDGTGMSDTLAQKHLIELLKWNASHVHKQPSKSDRHVWKI